MKNFYLKLFSVLSAFVLQVFFPTGSMAQCTCAGGVPATAINQSVTIAPIAASNITFTFNKFDPSIGTLSCINFVNTISGTSYTGARNTNKGNFHDASGEHVDSTDFLFSLSLLSKVAGPGITVNRTFNTTYGYDKLKAMDTIANIPGDTITYGPTNFITNPTTTVNITGNAAYIGTGTVDFNYTVNGGMITLDGGANYKSSVTSIIGGTLSLTYYWCPAAVLANGLQNFTAVKKDNNIVLKWDAQNAADINQYEIEYSLDGSSFSPVATLAANHSSTFNSYNYNYALNGASTGDVYFRIKQTNTAEKTGYSSIQKVSLVSKAGFAVAVYPNPVTNNMAISFDHALNGEYNVDLVNMSGQTVVSKKLKLAGANIIPVSWSNKPAPGIYFTRVTNTANMEQQIIRVVVQ
ncbi:MAG: choice-of-anchor E domain-containing protein [Chitinophagaceae bacterium]